MSRDTLSRRALLALAAASPLASAASRGKRIPVGLELYSVRDQLKQDLMGTVRAVAKMGYDSVEFADLTRYDAPESKALRARYGVTGVPEVLFFTPDGRERHELRVIGFLAAEPFLARLQAGAGG